MRQTTDKRVNESYVTNGQTDRQTDRPIAKSRVFASKFNSAICVKWTTGHVGLGSTFHEDMRKNNCLILVPSDLWISNLLSQLLVSSVFTKFEVFF